MASLSFDDESIHKISGTTGSEKGGLIIMKKGPSDSTSKHEFKAPTTLRPSLLGLDRLAALKRKNQSSLDRHNFL